MYKIDLHTHSTGSPDGGITLRQYARALEEKTLDYIAITDHNSIDTAVAIQKELGDQIIVGEEIMTSKGEIIGLFLQSEVPAGLSPLEAAKIIKDQGGITCIPHPFETVRHGLHPADLEDIEELIDIIEVFNGRAYFQNKSEQAAVWAKLNRTIGVASSDAHGVKGLGSAYTHVAEPVTRENLLDLLSSGTPYASRSSMRSLLYPKYHRIRNSLRARR